MKRLKATTILLVSTTALTAITFFSYIVNFGKNGISDDPEKWAYFGTYIGGMLAPIFAASAAIFALFTLRQQDRFFASQQLLSAIEKQETLLDSELESIEINILRGENSHKTNLKLLLMNSLLYDDAVKNLAEKADFYREGSDSDFHTRDMVTIVYHLAQASFRLEKLDELLRLHTEQSSSNALELTYKQKYNPLVDTLLKKGWYEGEWQRSS